MMFVHLLAPALFSALFMFSFESWEQYMLFVIGVFIGFVLLFLDRLLHVFFIAPETELSQEVRAAWHQHHVGRVVQILSSAKTAQEKLVTRSVFFFITYVALALYVLTSTGSHLGMGVILGLGLHYCIDLWQYRRDLTAFHKHFLWQVQRDLAEHEVFAIVAGFTLFFVLLCLLVLF